jgi:phosphate transport system permease protein
MLVIKEKQEIIFRRALWISAICILLLLISIFFTLLLSSMPSIRAFGISFVFGKTWDPVIVEFGALPFFAGTLLTSIMALAIATPFSISISIFLGEYFKEGIIHSILKTMIELLGGIPSIIYGFWGLFVLVPIIRAVEVKLNVPPYGVGLLTASLILAVMIIPLSASIGREVIEMVPGDIKEAGYSMGSTRFEVIRRIILPYARSGIFAGILLSFGRALGETMAVTMVIGNSNFLPKSIFDPSNTMASVIANEFTEATGDVYLSSLIEIGLLLFVLTTVINFAGRLIIRRMGFQDGR